MHKLLKMAPRAHIYVTAKSGNDFWPIAIFAAMTFMASWGSYRRRNGTGDGCANSRSGARHVETPAWDRAIFQRQGRVEPARGCAEPHHHRGGAGGAISHPARHRSR